MAFNYDPAMTNQALSMTGSNYRMPAIGEAQQFGQGNYAQFANNVGVEREQKKAAEKQRTDSLISMVANYYTAGLFGAAKAAGGGGGMSPGAKAIQTNPYADAVASNNRSSGESKGLLGGLLG